MLWEVSRKWLVRLAQLLGVSAVMVRWRWEGNVGEVVSAAQLHELPAHELSATESLLLSFGQTPIPDCHAIANALHTAVLVYFSFGQNMPNNNQ